MIMSCTRCQFVAFAKFIPEIVGLVPSKTVLEIFILVVANNSVFDVFATTGTLSYSTSYLLYNKGRDDRGICWPINSTNYNLCLIYRFY